MSAGGSFARAPAAPSDNLDDGHCHDERSGHRVAGPCHGVRLPIAGRSARYGTGFARVSYSGDFGGSWSLTRLVDAAKAGELDFLGDIIDTAAAASLGLVNRVMEDDALPFRGQISDVQQSSRPITLTMGNRRHTRAEPGQPWEIGGSTVCR